ncbi:ribonuclease D [Microbulbifer sp. TYP-18]|uniref:ribonuclease D n=1 Tax=Microbulbifer sp. TYP-18 TaxID=3230024 RepID=UPI0034C60E14
MSNVDTRPIWVESGPELAELCRRWRAQAMVALDTEFMRSRTFFPQPALVQVGDGERSYLIDNLAVDDLQPLRDLLQDTGVTKIMHSCSEDFETLQRLLDTVPAPIFDTQIAAAIAGMEAGLGYAATVKATLGIELPKSETRSDWLRRPLSEAQKNYAALDVAWLPAVYEVLLQRLCAKDRLQWLQEDCAALVTAAKSPTAPESYYWKVKGAWRLRGGNLAVLQEICAWREREARRRDLPRNHLLKESVCIAIAQGLPRHSAALAQVGIEGRALREYGDQLLQIVAQASKRADAPPSLPQPLNRLEGEDLKQLRQMVALVADQCGLPAEILVRRKELEHLVQAPQPKLEGRLRGWRAEVIGERLLQLLEKLRSEGAQ